MKLKIYPAILGEIEHAFESNSLGSGGELTLSFHLDQFSIRHADITFSSEELARIIDQLPSLPRYKPLRLEMTFQDEASADVEADTPDSL